MPPFHLIGVAKEDWSPFSLRINSLYSTSFVKYGFSVKPFNKTIYEKLSLLMVLGGRWNTEVSSLHHHHCDHFLFLSVSNILSLTMYVLKKCICTMEFILSSCNPCGPFLLEKFLDLRNCQLIQIWHYFVLCCNSVLLNHQVFCHILWAYVFNLQASRNN